MAALVWDESGSHYYELGVKNGILFPYDKATSDYAAGVAWNGLTSASESPDGADANDIYADDITYASIRGPEKFNGSIEAYTYPDEFAECDGSVFAVAGVKIGQQARKAFGFCFRSTVGNDVDMETAYKLHLWYGLTASPSEKSYETINDSPDANTFSWDVTSSPISLNGYRPVSSIEIDSRTANATKLAALETILYGDATHEPRLPLPSEVITLMNPNGTTGQTSAG